MTYRAAIIDARSKLRLLATQIKTCFRRVRILGRRNGVRVADLSVPVGLRPLPSNVAQDLLRALLSGVPGGLMRAGAIAAERLYIQPPRTGPAPPHRIFRLRPRPG